MNRLTKMAMLTALVALNSACTQLETSSSEGDEKLKNAPEMTFKNEDASSENPEVKANEKPGKTVTETRSVGSHSHGDASLAIVLEGAEVAIELDTPLYNLLGFEHVAETQSQKLAVQKAEEMLSDPTSLFIFTKAAMCETSNIASPVELPVEHSHEEHAHEKNDEDAHDHHHGEGGQQDTHKDVTLRYNFSCKNPNSLTDITVKLFDRFENLSELDLVYLGPNTQKQSKLSAAKSRMDLTR